jgi:class 3 adenylate cyclase
MPSSPSIRQRLLRLVVLGNLGGAVLTFVYFREVDPIAGGVEVGAADLAFFAFGFSLLSVAGRFASGRWVRPLAQSGVEPAAGAEGSLARRRALLMPAFMALLTFTGWAAAGLLWGVLWPLLAGRFALEPALRQLFGITFVSGTFVAACMFLGVERIWRNELPRFFPAGDLSAVRVPRLRVRPRMLAVLLIVSLLPMAVLAVAALSRAQAVQADPGASAVIIGNLVAVIAFLVAGGVVVSAGLATLVASSIARPLGEVERAMLQVRDGALDVRCTVVSNDEIGSVAEGFNGMVDGLRERERIRETFGRYVGPEVRDEILAGRADAAGVQHQVTILFADLRDFTPWVEATPAEEVVADLNAYFGEMDAAIRECGGFVLQFIGDEIEAVFGAPVACPGHADAAVAAARAMRARLAAWNDGRRSAGRHELRHGIGIHSGTVVAGNIGSGERLSYALVGDAVNVASRIQALNKELGTTVLLSGATCARLGSTSGCKSLPDMQVKGHRAAMSIYALD